MIDPRSGARTAPRQGHCESHGEGEGAAQRVVRLCGRSSSVLEWYDRSMFRRPHRPPPRPRRKPRRRRMRCSECSASVRRCPECSASVGVRVL